ncbi:DUF4290 domain-containing protein [Polluticaenibacter yanchengensis]|uniref:DUF4290 domain-containing protein n=1 Tax=Polluticaenibacter yanchengensis TaxID=3014562 RepID=A0ABT4UKY3_9BACT|nr:DUF4290 domain-containing protein [Chitinophagaceae bacterium LY-5]
MEYNTSRGHLLMREYGRHIQKMVDYLLSIEDREARTKNAKAIIELMTFLNPQLKTIEDYKHKLWDHLHFMSDFKLNVDAPYPVPTKETYKSKPEPLPYPNRNPRYNHLGKNIELVINKALSEEDPQKKSGFAHSIAYYMKLAYSTWHKELVHDDNIRQELNAITNGELEFTNTPYVRHRTNAGNNDDYGIKRSNNKFRQGSSGSGASRMNAGGGSNMNRTNSNSNRSNNSSNRNNNNSNNNNNNRSNNNNNRNSNNNNNKFQKRNFR